MLNNFRTILFNWHNTCFFKRHLSDFFFLSLHCSGHWKGLYTQVGGYKEGPFNKITLFLENDRTHE